MALTLPPRRVAVMIDLNQALAHHQQVYAGIHRYAREHNRWECVLSPHVELGSPGKAGLDGVVGRITRELASRARKAGVPVVNVWVNSPAEGLAAVLPDAKEAGRIVAEHFKARGFSLLGYLGLREDRVSQQQWIGMRGSSAKSRDRCSACWVSQEFTRTAAEWQEFQRALNAWIDGWRLPIGVMVADDMLCRHLAEACLARRLEIPRQVALVGTGNERVACLLPDPALSSVDYGFNRIGYQAAKLLDELMDGAPPTKPIRLAPAGLLVRRSSDAFAVDDPLVARALRYMTEHAHERIGVAEVAASAAAARRTLSRLFLKSLGKSIHDMLIHLRLERAKRQLIEPGVSLKTVAVECGFRDAIHLYKVFQKVEGVTPAEYRKAHQAAAADSSLPTPKPAGEP